MSTYKLHLVLARYRENIDWVFDALRLHRDWCAFVYNDGADITVPHDIQDQIKVLDGDRIPSEPSKYLRYIIDFWGCFDDDTQVAFLQADPMYHNPTILGVLDNHDKWNRTYQHLTLIAHPPPWGVAKQILEGSINNITTLADNARVWHDSMDNDFQGSLYYDAWIRDLLKDRKADITVSSMCNLFRISPPAEMKKVYSALFSSTWQTINRLGQDRFKAMHRFLVEGESGKDNNMSVWDRSCIMEYMWSVIFEGTPICTP